MVVSYLTKLTTPLTAAASTTDETFQDLWDLLGRALVLSATCVPALSDDDFSTFV